MIKYLSFYDSSCFNPYHNQAIEEYFLDRCHDDELIFYLWQNQRTVFIGKNQDAYNECQIAKLEEDHGFIARRISGGGAVYHDLGNLNFTFISTKNNYDVNKQTDVILKALNYLNIKANKNKRNDLEYKELKFSGHAYYQRKDKAFHHGTLMLNVNKEELSSYLKVSIHKLNKHHVASVKSRIINLIDINNNLTIKVLKDALLKAYKDIYGLDYQVINNDELDIKKIKELENKFADNNWKYGKIYNYPFLKEKKYVWGIVRIIYDLKDNYLNDLIIYTDSLYLDEIENIPKKFINNKIEELKASNNIEEDIIDLLKGE